jgi:cobyrinic acid a,c-diamide synthase
MAVVEIPRIVIAGATSGVGKTVISAGVTRALIRRGLRVATFKAGPDFIDPSYLELASGRPCHNLDTWMLPRAALLEIFARSAESADVAIVEGMMGLFDGRGPASDDGSTAQLATTLRAPVVLVVDASRAARSIAALVDGYRRFDRRVALVAAIANSVASERHAEWVCQAIGTQTSVRVLGAVQRNPGLTVPSRHLGLVQAGESANANASIDDAADLVESTLDLDTLLELARAAPPLRTTRTPTPSPDERVRIGVARDAAFSFYYAANLELLEHHGADIVEFSPLTDRELPNGIAGIYLGGGYPELHATALASNEAMKHAIRGANLAGMPIYAECGGMLYLGRKLVDLENRSHQLVGVLNFEAVMEPRRVALGYAESTALRDTPMLKAGAAARGHEFHYSRIVKRPEAHVPAYRVETSSGTCEDGFAVGSLVASYVHLHFASQPKLVPRWLDGCRAWRKIDMIPAHPLTERSARGDSSHPRRRKSRAASEDATSEQDRQINPDAD